MSPPTALPWVCPCRPGCDAHPRHGGSTYARGHDARASARMCKGSGMTAFKAAAYLKARFGSVGAADLAGLLAECRDEIARLDRLGVRRANDLLRRIDAATTDNAREGR